MSRSSRNGYTLIEVIVVIAIIAVLIGLLLPSVRRVREPAARAQCQNNLKQLMFAFHEYQSMSGSDVPSTQSFPQGCLGSGSTPEERLSWIVALLPYLEQHSLYQQFDREKGYAGNLPATQTHVRVLMCPAAKQTEKKEAVTTYIAMSGIGPEAARHPAGASGNGFMGFDRLTSLAMIEDGTSNTIALMETRSNLGPWARGGSSNLRGYVPTDLPLHGDQRPFGGHDSGMQAAMADGSVRFLRSTIDPMQLAAAITINGGEQVGLE